MGKARYRLTWNKEFDGAVKRVAEREGMNMEQFIQASAALYGALSNLCRGGTKVFFVHPDGTKEQFVWETGSTNIVEEEVK